jgi:hypothetical protein
MKNPAISYFTRALQLVIAAVAICVGILFVSKRIEAVEPAHGDIAVWITVHEFLKRGHSLYRDVWDHKDPGFFTWSHPFFETWGTEGLYMFGFLTTILFGAGIFFAIKKLIGKTAAIVIAAAATITYSSLTSFYSVYTENYAAGFASLGAGLFFASPLLAGFFLAVSTTIKISGLLIFSSIVVFTLSLNILRSLQRKSCEFQRILTFIFGFLGGLALFSAISLGDFSVADWQEVFNFNREYSSAYRGRPFVIGDFYTLPKTAPPEIPLIAGFICLSLLSALALRLLPISRSPKHTAITEVAVALAFIVGTYGAIMLQFPVRVQHWQYFAAGLIYASAVTLCAAYVAVPGRTMRIVVTILYAMPALKLIAPAISLNDADNWRLAFAVAHRQGELSQTLSKLPSGSSVAIFGGNTDRLAWENAPQTIHLACRFHYQFDHFANRYAAEILECVDKSPDYVIINNRSAAPFTKPAIDRVLREYSTCASEFWLYSVYGRNTALCEKLK